MAIKWIEPKMSHLINSTTGKARCGRKNAPNLTSDKTMVRCTRCRQLENFTVRVIDGKAIVMSRES